MKVLWLCNLIPPQAGEALGISGIPKEGWGEGLMTAMALSGKDVELAVAFPVSEEYDGKRGSFFIGEEFEVTYFAFSEDTVHPEKFDLQLEGRMNRILDEYHPDVVHIFGTEFPHALAMGKAACGDDFHYHPGKERVLITFYSGAVVNPYYMFGVNNKVIILGDMDSEKTDASRSYLNYIKNHCFDKHRDIFFVPKSKDELKEYLN